MNKRINIINIFKFSFGALLIIIFPQSANATQYSGNITSVVNSSATNYAFRIYLSNDLVSCSAHFAYMNVSDDNYQVKSSTLLAAFYTGKSIIITTDVDGSGFCRITDLSVAG